MCGICGLARIASAVPIEEAAVRRMTDVIAHRGPGDSGVLAELNFAYSERTSMAAFVEVRVPPLDQPLAAV